MRAFLIKEMFQAIKIPSYNNLGKVIPMVCHSKTTTDLNKTK